MLAACARLRHVWDMYEDDVEARNRLVDELVRLSVLGRSDLRHGVDKSTVSKMRRAGEWASVLGRAEILVRLSPGYSVLYAAARLLEVMTGEHDERADQMIELFAGMAGGITREFLEREVARRIKKPRSKKAPAANHDFPEATDLLVITPRESDWKRLRSDQANADTISRCLRLDQIGTPEAVMIISPLREMLASIKLLACCGFDQMSHILLTASPPIPEVIDTTVVITAERKPGQVIVVPLEWTPSYPDPVDAKAIALELAPNAKTKVHILALSELHIFDGWTSLVASDVWNEELG